MKKLLIIWLIVVAICAIVLTMLWSGVAPRRGLVVNKLKILNETIVVNTHPQQPMELNPWQQPRLVIKMDWSINNKEQVRIVLSFLSMAKTVKLCSGLVIIKGLGTIGQATHEYKIMKSGVWEAVYIPINIDTLHQLAFVKMPYKFRVCGVEFYLHKYEAEDLRQAIELWRRW